MHIVIAKASKMSPRLSVEKVQLGLCIRKRVIAGFSSLITHVFFFKVEGILPWAVQGEGTLVETTMHRTAFEWHAYRT